MVELPATWGSEVRRHVDGAVVVVGSAVVLHVVVGYSIASGGEEACGRGVREWRR